MDFNAVCTALAAAADTIDGLNTHDFVPDAVSEPCFYPHTIAVEFDTDFGGGVEAVITCMVLVSRADDRAGQESLRAFMGDGSASLKAALEAARGAPGELALDGAADDFRVERINEYGVYTVGEVAFYGAKLIVRVIGS